MIDWELCQRLMNCFPGSFLNHNVEFIAEPKTNQYFLLKDCENEFDVKCKILEWLSRAAYKTEPYGTKKKNDELHGFMLKGINEFLRTSFTKEDMEQIYTYLGNACNHAKTMKFVESGYDMKILEGRRADDRKTDDVPPANNQ